MAHPTKSFFNSGSDDTVHTSDSHFNEDIVVRLIGENTKFITPIFTETGLKIYPVLGNHDAFPKSHFSPIPAENDLYSKVGDLWASFLPAEAAESFKTKGERQTGRNQLLERKIINKMLERFPRILFFKLIVFAAVVAQW